MFMSITIRFIGIGKMGSTLIIQEFKLDDAMLMLQIAPFFFLQPDEGMSLAVPEGNLRSGEVAVTVAAALIQRRDQV